ncbi:MAG TPA: TetR/AcrR family transcriptional regulator [Microthrixaceae bacterium]|nr:TetR/AcrR family transcriptional regulator [Microthrixaceae bacterium]
MSPSRSASTRERLLAATIESLRTKGMHGLTSREITGVAEVNLQAITYHFGSKDSLVATALTELVNRRLDPIVEALETDADPAERLFDALATIRTTFAVGREDLKAYADAVAAASSNAELARSIGDIHDRLRGYLSGLITEMQRDGYVQRWVEPDSMASLLIAIGDGLATQAHFGEPDVDGVLDQVALLLLSARDQKNRVWPTAARLMIRRMGRR